MGNAETYAHCSRTQQAGRSRGIFIPPQVCYTELQNNTSPKALAETPVQAISLPGHLSGCREPLVKVTKMVMDTEPCMFSHGLRF